MEKENTETPETTTTNLDWYKAQRKELLDIRKTYYEMFGGTNDDAYFPDLVKNKFQVLKNVLNLIKGM